MKQTDSDRQTLQTGKPVEFPDLTAESLPPEVVAKLIDDSLAEYDASDPLLDSYKTNPR